jgi:hypothetical protein
VGLLGGILTYVVEAEIIESNPAHGIRKPRRDLALTHIKRESGRNVK